MSILDLFSGVGGFSLGLTRAGVKITKHYYSEIDKYAIAVYKHNFKDAKYVGDVTTISGIERPNIITFGSPCQDFSIAGKRAGMGGKRSSLIEYAINLIADYRPDVFIWENVKGAFSSNSGEDFWGIIQAFTNIGGYRLEWQLLNTSWFLPQNRERIYLIGHLAGGRSREVFPIGGNDGKIDRGNGEAWARIIDPNYLDRDCNVYYNQSPCLNQRNYKDPPIVQVGDYRKDEGFRIRKDGNSPAIQVRAREDKYGVPMVLSKDKIDYYKKDKCQSNRIYKETGIAPTLPSRGDNTGNNAPMITTAQPRCVDPKKGGTGELSSTEYSFTINRTPHIVNKIRRLTPIECERLQGFPDNWTQYGNFDGEIKEISDSQRYKMCGNAVTVDVVEAIGKRLFKEKR